MAFSVNAFLRRPYVLVLVTLLLLTDIGGIVHAFRRHRASDGVLALVLPPYGLYHAVESFSHRAYTDADIAKLSQSKEGRRTLAAELRLSPNIWNALLNLITVQKNSEVRTTMEETGVPYDIIASVPKDGPVTLTVQSRENSTVKISMIDADRDQNPETLVITKHVNGKPDVTTTPLEQFSDDDASQFLLAWSLAWGTIAEEQKAKLQGSSVSSVK